MRPPPEGVQHQELEAPELITRGRWHRFHIGQVGDRPEAVTEHFSGTVGKGERQDLETTDGHLRSLPQRVQR